MSQPTLEPERMPPLRPAFLLRLGREYRPWIGRLLGVLVLVVVATFFTLAQPLLLRNLVDLASLRTDDPWRLGVAAGLLVLMPVLAALLGVIQRRLLGVVAADMQFDLRNRIYAHLQRLPYRMYVHAPPGEINARLSGDLQQTGQLILQSIPDGLGHILRLVGSLAALFVLEWRLTLASLLILPLAAWVSRRRNYAARKLALRTMQIQSALGLQTGETIHASGVMNTRLFDRRDDELARYRELSAQVRAADVENNQMIGMSIVWSSMIAAVGTGLVYAVGGLLVFGSQTLTIGSVIAFVAYLGGLYASLQALMSLPQGMALALVGYERIFELLDLPTEDPGPQRTDLPVRARGELAFEQVAFQFNDEIPLRATARPWSTSLMGATALREATPAGQNALESISFRVAPGEMLAIVGPSGAGKSTIFNLIPRFYDPLAGQITLDGEDLRRLPLDWLRRQISVVSQGVHILPGTLADNLRYARPNASTEDLLAACRAARLEEWLDSLPDGLDTFLGQSGARLSGGERQRLAIARALLKDAPLLLLDEATSHLDSINESLLQDALFRVRQNRTTLVIAHRLSTVHTANMILVLEHGRIVERGSHAHLLGLGGLYARLYEKQFIPAGQEPS